MFTGLIEEIGAIAAVPRAGGGLRLAVRARRVLEGLAAGDSISVSGVCLTVEEVGEDRFAARVMPETIRSSAVGSYRAGRRVNLERALRLGDRLGGHLVQGHVDGVGQVLAVTAAGDSRALTISCPAELSRYLARKGSVAVDGVSLTIVEAGADRFSVSLVRATLEATTLGTAKQGEPVNIEVDLLARHIERFLAEREPSRLASLLEAEYGE